MKSVSMNRANLFSPSHSPFHAFAWGEVAPRTNHCRGNTIIHIHQFGYYLFFFSCYYVILGWVWSMVLWRDLRREKKRFRGNYPNMSELYLKGLFHRLRALIALNCSLIFVTGTLISPSFAPLFFSSSFLVWTCVTKLYCLPDKNIYVFNFFLAISSGNFLWRILMQLGRSLSIVIFWYSVN